jgi:hypothetical protein
MASVRKRETHSFGNGSIYLIGDWLETRLSDPGDYIARVTCICSKRVTVAVELWLWPNLQSQVDTVFPPNHPDVEDIPFTTLSSNTDVRVAIVDINGANSGIDFSIDSEILTDTGSIPSVVRGRRG